MKIEEFKSELRSELNRICAERQWKYDNPKQRGMAFEDWCFRLLSERYPAADNDPAQCIRANSANTPRSESEQRVHECLIVWNLH